MLSRLSGVGIYLYANRVIISSIILEQNVVDSMHVGCSMIAFSWILISVTSSWIGKGEHEHRSDPHATIRSSIYSISSNLVALHYSNNRLSQRKIGSCWLLLAFLAPSRLIYTSSRDFSPPHFGIVRTTSYPRYPLRVQSQSRHSDSTLDTHCITQATSRQHGLHTAR